jgi:hypothetical protein
MDAGTIESHRDHGGTDQTWSSCWACMTARRAAKAAPKWTARDYKAARIVTRQYPADGYVTTGTCRRCGTCCYGDCRS